MKGVAADVERDERQHAHDTPELATDRSRQRNSHNIPRPHEGKDVLQYTEKGPKHGKGVNDVANQNHDGVRRRNSLGEKFADGSPKAPHSISSQ